MFNSFFKSPDGYDMDGPYWFLPSDRKTHSFHEWLEADKEWRKSYEN